MGADVDDEIAGADELAEAVDLLLGDRLLADAGVPPLGELDDAVGRQVEPADLGAPLGERDVRTATKKAAERHGGACRQRGDDGWRQGNDSAGFPQRESLAATLSHRRRRTNA